MHDYNKQIYCIYIYKISNDNLREIILANSAINIVY